MNNLFAERVFSSLGMIIFSVDTRVNNSLINCTEYAILFVLFSFLDKLAIQVVLQRPR